MTTNFNDYYREFAPLDTLLADDSVSEIMVNGHEQVYVEMAGQLRESEVKFESREELLRIITLLGEKVGRRIDAAMPLLDARMADGSRVNAVLEPVSVGGPTLTIRKFSRKPLSASDLIDSGTCSVPALAFLEAAVAARLNIVVSGGTSTGKTTLLNVLSGFIGSTERIVTIEDTAELQLRQRHVVTLEARPTTEAGETKIAIRDLVVNALRMRPDRMVVGECRAEETMDMLQAMNTGHDGGLTTMHASSPRDTIARLETMAMMAGLEIPLPSIRRQIVAAINIIVQMGRLRDGSRRVINISEVIGMEGEVVTMQDIFEFEARGMDSDGRVVGGLAVRSLRPRLLTRMDEAGVPYPVELAKVWQQRPVGWR